MKENRINATIAITFLIAALVMLAALSFAIGKWSWENKRYDLTVYFPSASGIGPNSAVKFAGASIGRVKTVTLIPRKEQKIDPKTNLYNYVAVVIEIDDSVEVTADTEVAIKQDGLGIAAKYILLSPGTDRDAKILVNGDEMQGEMAFDLTSLIQPAGEALQEAKAMVEQLRPILKRFDVLSDKLETDLPTLLANGNVFLKTGNTFLGNGNTFVSNLNTPTNRQHLNDTLANLKVSTENLKVVSSNTKALTLTLAEKPWRVFWGGPTIPAPPEQTVLKSNKVILLKPDVDVTAAPPPAPTKHN